MYTYNARAVRVIDGDTVVLDLDLGFHQWRLGQSYRLIRIDAPERNTPAGQTARSALAGKLGSARTLVVSTQKSDNFARWLIELVADGENISDWMVAQEHATYKTYS